MAATYAQRDYPAIPEIRTDRRDRRRADGRRDRAGGGAGGLRGSACRTCRGRRSTPRSSRIDYFLGRQVEKDVLSEADKRDALARISDRRQACELFGDCDLVIEAATENEEIKRKIFAGLLPSLQPGAILASNTSSISITRLAAITDRPERFIGMHFMNPVPAMKLVEIIRGIATEEDTYQSIKARGREAGQDLGDGRGLSRPSSSTASCCR